MKVLAVLVGVILASVLVVGCAGGSHTFTRDISVPAGQSQIIAIELQSGDTLSVAVSVKGGGTPLDIGVSVEGPSGEKITTRERNRSHSFAVTAAQTGRYHIILDNTYSPLAPKLVTLTLKY